MNPSHDWNEVKLLFQAALDLPQDQHERFLAEKCDHPATREEVMTLLRKHADSTEVQFLQSPLDHAGRLPHGDSTSHYAQSSADPLIGKCLGGFEVVRRIGSGGMGAVYEAQQEHPHRRGAIKVLRPGFATHQTLRRFEFEAEILAKLHHPGIAHVYAAGTFDLGDGAQPWFAMELIEGQSLTEFAKSRTLTTQAKLQLLLMICDAVQHAHERGVIHRDLKPANIMIDPAGIAKILDFGVARVTDRERPHSVQTAIGELVGTLNYMSPEQIAGDPEAIDARCDVYALGVVGFELLAGCLPHDRSSSIATMLRSIEHHHTQQLGKVDAAFRGDIETIFAKALEHQAARRYESVAAFAGDLRRYLNHEPVLARPASSVYRFKKFIRRNRIAAAGVASTMVALIVGLVVYANEAAQSRKEAARSQYEADKAVAINNFMVNDFLMKLLAAVSTQQSAGGEQERLNVAGLVDQACANIASMFEHEPMAEAAVRNEVATIYYNLGVFEKAAEQYQAAMDGWERTLGPDHEDTLKAVNNLGQAFAAMRKPELAEPLFERALEGRLRLLGEEDAFTLVTMNNLAILWRATGRLEESQAMLRRTLGIQRRVLGESHKNTLITKLNLGSLLVAIDSIDEAVALHREVYEGGRRTMGDDHITTLQFGARLGQTLLRADQAEEAHSLLAELVKSMEQMLGNAAGEVITARRALARACIALKKNDEALQHLRDALEGARSKSEARFAEMAAAIEKEIAELDNAD